MTVPAKKVETIKKCVDIFSFLLEATPPTIEDLHLGCGLCMYVYIYVCMYVCMHELSCPDDWHFYFCIFVYMFIRMYACGCLMYVRTYENMIVCMYVCKNMCTYYNFKCMKCMYGVSVFLYARTLETSGSSGLKFKSAGVYRSMHAVCKPRRIADAHTQRFIDPKVWVEVCMYVCVHVFFYVCTLACTNCKFIYG